MMPLNEIKIRPTRSDRVTLEQNFEIDQHIHAHIQHSHLPAHQSLADNTYSPLILGWRFSLFRPLSAGRTYISCSGNSETRVLNLVRSNKIRDRSLQTIMTSKVCGLSEPEHPHDRTLESIQEESRLSITCAFLRKGWPEFRRRSLGCAPINPSFK